MTGGINKHMQEAALSYFRVLILQLFKTEENQQKLIFFK
jgi:hypothetical protein